MRVLETQPNYRPPLTNNLFDHRPTFEAILKQYPGAMSLASTIGLKIRHHGVSMEALLRAMQEEGQHHVLRRLRQFPLYLQHLFWEISTNYTSEPENYTHLVSELLSPQIDKIALVTLNYDLFLENSLRPIEGQQIDNLDFYVLPDRKWMLVKLHGSVNWGRIVKDAVSDVHSNQAAIDLVTHYPVEKNLLDEIILLSHYTHRWSDDLNLIYPALSIPVEGKYEYVCPKSHVSALKEFLPSCPNYLIIGVSGKDDDLLDLLANHITQCERVTIVGGEDVAEVDARFSTKVPQFDSVERKLYREGFNSFIVNREFDRFLSAL